MKSVDAQPIELLANGRYTESQVSHVPLGLLATYGVWIYRSTLQATGVLLMYIGNIGRLRLPARNENLHNTCYIECTAMQNQFRPDKSLRLTIAAFRLQLLAALVLGMNFMTVLTADENGRALRNYLQRSYPSLAYVARYRQTFPAEIQGSDQLWKPTVEIPNLPNAQVIGNALAGLQDQHVGLLDPANTVKAETLGLLFRTSSDAHMIVWRIFEPAITDISVGDEILTINGMPTAKWLAQTAALTFGGNRRSRIAEAALELGIASPITHIIAKLGASVTLQLEKTDGTHYQRNLTYIPMSGERAAAMANALDKPDLPVTITIPGHTIATVRLGAFAPQFDPVFNAAADEKAQDKDAKEVDAMLAGFCAVVRSFITKVDSVSENADTLVLDLRGNFGGFGREARLLSQALVPVGMASSFDVFATGRPGTLRLERQSNDPSCGHIAKQQPLIVLTDAGTRSSGELMTTWLWSAGAFVAGEQTIGAGGGRDADSKGFALPKSDIRVLMSGNFTFFDNSGILKEGEMTESALVDMVTKDKFAPSRTRPYAIQSIGVRPDLTRASSQADLHDGGEAYVKAIVQQFMDSNKGSTK